MSKSFVLITAMPPTKGHLQLIQFANNISDTTHVIVATQPDEPYTLQRYESVRQACAGMKRTFVFHYNKEVNQDPNSIGFWDRWKGILYGFGMRPGDYFVASESYGVKLAEVTKTKFIPYDINRDVINIKAKTVRWFPQAFFKYMLPEFQQIIRPTITLFGAESTGKTKLAKRLAKEWDTWYLFEWARPYLETCGNEISVDSMNDIWLGQRALQLQAKSLYDKMAVIQDTDLFSTVGYWNMYTKDHRDFPDTPKELIYDAMGLKSDLYLICPSNIPFEPDPLRYGGEVRESTDQFWINLCEQYNLNYKVLTESYFDDRVYEAGMYIGDLWDKINKSLYYERQFNE